MTASRAEIVATLAVRYGIRLDQDDPVFMLVEINQLMLQDQLDEFKATYEAARSAIDVLAQVAAVVELEFKKDMLGTRRATNELAGLALQIRAQLEAIHGDEQSRRRVSELPAQSRPGRFTSHGSSIAIAYASLSTSLAWTVALSLLRYFTR